MQIQAVFEPVALEKVVEELGAFELGLRKNFVHQHRAAAFAQPVSDGVAELIIALVATQVVEVHVDGDAVAIAALARAPNIGGEKIGLQQTKQRSPHAKPNLRVAVILREQAHEMRQRTGLLGVEMHGQPLRAMREVNSFARRRQFSGWSEN